VHSIERRLTALDVKTAVASTATFAPACRCESKGHIRIEGARPRALGVPQRQRKAVHHDPFVLDSRAHPATSTAALRSSVQPIQPCMHIPKLMPSRAISVPGPSDVGRSAPVIKTVKA
jgi:hypothetical protein